ncbi:MAG: hypothetical protein VB878_18745, partial [Pirellulaceae bacterium]
VFFINHLIPSSIELTSLPLAITKNIGLLSILKAGRPDSRVSSGYLELVVTSRKCPARHGLWPGGDE